MPTPQQKGNASALIKIVRESTERFKDVSVAEAEGYALQFGCVTGPDSGAMGLHYVNGDLVNRGELDPTRPQIVIYEPTPNGGLRLIGADFLLLANAFVQPIVIITRGCRGSKRSTIPIIFQRQSEHPAGGEGNGSVR
jgi:hypothetical protein